MFLHKPSDELQRTIPTKKDMAHVMMVNPLLLQKEMNRRKFFEFFKYFWPSMSNDTLVLNFHIEYLCNELQLIAENVFLRKPKLHDLIINIPPGTTKTTLVNIAWPVWCWTRDFTVQIISTGYSGVLALESAEKARDLVRSDLFSMMYPEIDIKADKDVKSNFRIVKKNIAENPMRRNVTTTNGGNRFSTSVGGTLTGFHGHILIVDDPLNPYEQNSPKIVNSTNDWIDQVLLTRKVDKEVTAMVMVMQRVHENDPTGHMLKKNKDNVKHICLPGDIKVYKEFLKPQSLAQYYTDGLLDPKRLSRKVLNEMEADLGQYGYAGQVGQNPSPPGGGMFKIDQFNVITSLLHYEITQTVRYWDKAGTQGGGCYTVGVKMNRTKCGKYIITDVKRGQWEAFERERIIKSITEADGVGVNQYIEQEPGSGGKESAESTIRNLSGYVCIADRPTGDKVFRADPYSVQVNNGNVLLLHGDWNHEYIKEHELFPLGHYKDQVDASSGAFAKLTIKKQVKAWGGHK